MFVVILYCAFTVSLHTMKVPFSKCMMMMIVFMQSLFVDSEKKKSEFCLC